MSRGWMPRLASCLAPALLLGCASAGRAVKPPGPPIAPGAPAQASSIEIAVRTVTSDGLELCGLRVNGEGHHGADEFAHLDAVVRVAPRPVRHAPFLVTLVGAFALNVAFDLPSSEWQDGTVDLVLPDTQVTRGRLIDPGGAPLAGVHVVLSVGGPPNHTYLEYVTRMRRRCVAPGEIVEEEETVLFRRTWSGKAWIVELNRRAREDSIATLDARTNADGEFAFAGLVPGRPYTLTWPGGFGLWATPGVPFGHAAEPMVITASLHGIQVRAVDATTGTVLREATTWLRKPAGWKGPLTNPEGFTPEHAPHVPRGLVLGDPGSRCELIVTCPGYDDARLEVAIAAEPGTPLRDVALSATTPADAEQP